MVQKLIDNTKPTAPLPTTKTANPLAPLAPLKPSSPFSNLTDSKLSKDTPINEAANGKDKNVDAKKDLKSITGEKENKTNDIKDNKEKEKDIKAAHDTKPAQEKGKEEVKGKEDVAGKEQANKPAEKPTPIPSKPPVLGSLPGLGKLGLPSLSQPLSKPAPILSSLSSSNKDKPFKHALDSEEDDLLEGEDDDLDDLLDEDKLCKSLSDSDLDRDLLKKENLHDFKRKQVNEPLLSDEDSYRSDEDDELVYNKAGKGSAPAPKRDLDLDLDSDDDLAYNKPTKGNAPAKKNDELDLHSDDDDLYNDEFLEEVEEEEDGDIHSSEGEEDLNKLDDNELNRRKAQMNLSFEKNRKLPSDPGFKYDVQV